MPTQYITKTCNRCHEVKPHYIRKSGHKADKPVGLCVDCAREYKRKYRERTSEYNREYSKRRAPRDNIKMRAVSRSLRMVRDGLVPEATSCLCFVCGECAEEYHHVDYTKPTEVIPVCRSCHQRWHNAFSPVYGENRSNKPAGKLTSSDVLEIRSLHASGMTQRALAEKFNVTFANIHCVVRRKSWTHI